MPAAKKASKASHTKTTGNLKVAPRAKAKVKAKSPAKLMGQPKLTLVPKAPQKTVAPRGGRKKGSALVKGRSAAAAEPRNIIMELWKAKEEKRRNESPHAKFHQTGPPTHATHHKHDRFARYVGPRKKAL